MEKKKCVCLTIGFPRLEGAFHWALYVMAGEEDMGVCGEFKSNRRKDRQVNGNSSNPFLNLNETGDKNNFSL